MDFAQGIANCIAEHGSKAFVLGTRKADPNAGGQQFFEPSSDWMPPFMRVNPNPNPNPNPSPNPSPNSNPNPNPNPNRNPNSNSNPNPNPNLGASTPRSTGTTRMCGTSSTGLSCPC